MSKVEIVAENADGDVFVGWGEVTWDAMRVEDSGKAFKPHAIHSWRILEDDGSVIGWMPMPLKEGDDDDEAESEG